MYEECIKLVNSLEPSTMDALEISSGFKWKNLGFKSFTTEDYPLTVWTLARKRIE